MDRTDLDKFIGKHVIFIPIRSFSNSKSRLGHVLNSEQRKRFMIKSAETVITACHGTPCIILSSDEEVSTFAHSLDIDVLAEFGNGLNINAQSTLELSRETGIEHITIAHADLPLACNIAQMYIKDKICIAPDRRHDGTNVLSLPTKFDFHFFYGPNSFSSHMKEAQNKNLPVRVIEDELLMLDVDTVDDVEFIRSKYGYQI